MRDRDGEIAPSGQLIPSFYLTITRPRQHQNTVFLSPIRDCDLSTRELPWGKRRSMAKWMGGRILFCAENSRVNENLWTSSSSLRAHAQNMGRNRRRGKREEINERMREWSVSWIWRSLLPPSNSPLSRRLPKMLQQPRGNRKKITCAARISLLIAQPFE